MDRRFLKGAARGCLTQLRLDKIAGERGSRLRTRDLAQRIQTADDRLWDQVSTLAARKDVRIHRTLDPSELAAITRLSQRPNAGFDQAFVRLEVNRLMKTLLLFQQEAVAHHSDPEVVHFAFVKLPSVRRRLDMAQRLEHVQPY